jgi:Mn-containing catalase
MLLDTSTEEIGHVEMIATMVARLLETSPVEAEKAAENGGDGGVVGAVLGGGDTQQAIINAAMNPQHAIVTGLGAAPRDSQGNPWNAAYTIASGNLLADMRFNVTAESQGRLQVARLYQLTQDAGVRDMFSFLLARDVMHQNQWLAALEELKSKGLEDTPSHPTSPRSWRCLRWPTSSRTSRRVSRAGRVAGRAGRPWTARGSSSTWQSLRRWVPRWTS